MQRESPTATWIRDVAWCVLRYTLRTEGLCCRIMYHMGHISLAHTMACTRVPVFVCMAVVVGVEIWTGFEKVKLSSQVSGLGLPSIGLACTCDFTSGATICQDRIQYRGHLAILYTGQ